MRAMHTIPEVTSIQRGRRRYYRMSDHFVENKRAENIEEGGMGWGYFAAVGRERDEF